MRADRVTVHDLRRRRTTFRGARGSGIGAVVLKPSGVVGWIADAATGRGVFVNGNLDRGVGAADPSFLGLAGGVLLVRYAGGYGAQALDETSKVGDGRLARIGSVRLEASDGVVFARRANGRRLRVGSAYTQDSASAGGGLDRLLVVGTRVAGRSNGYGIGGEPAGGEVRVLDVARRAARTECVTPQWVEDVVMTRSGHVACVVGTDVLNEIVADGLVIDRFPRTQAALTIGAGKLVWRRDGQTFTGPLPGAVVCGPKAATTLGQSGEARVYRRGSAAEACDATSGRTLALGPASRVLETILAGRYAALRRRDDGAETLTVYDLREARAVGLPARASAMTAIALGDTGIGAYVSAEGAGDTVSGTYAGTAGTYRFFIRVVDSLVVWGTAEQLHLRRADDSPVRDARVWSLGGPFTLHVAQGRLVSGDPASASSPVLGPLPAGCAGPAGCTGVTTVGYGGASVGALDGGVLTVHDPGPSTRQPCPPPVRAFAIDYGGRVTCS